MAERLAEAAEDRQTIDRDKERGDGEDAEKHPHFLAAQRLPELSDQNKIVDREVHGKEDHENGHDRLRIGIVRAHTDVADRKAARARRGERRGERVEARHIKKKKHEHRNREADVDKVQNRRAAAHPRYELADVHTRRFRAQEMQRIAAVAVRHGAHGQHEHEHAHTAEPYRKAPPVLKAHRQRLHIGDHACAGCGEPGNGLKKGIHKRRHRSAQTERKRAEYR